MASCFIHSVFSCHIVEVNGIKAGFLSFASVYQAGYEAKKSVPGLSPVRVHSHYYIADWDAYGKVESRVVKDRKQPEDKSDDADPHGVLPPAPERTRTHFP